MTAVRRRPAARVVLLDADDRVLLFDFRSPETGRRWWLTPGGGVDAGETHEEAALREVAEECGITDVALGPCIWMREHEFTWRGVRYLQMERFFVARVVQFEPSPERWTEEEQTVIADSRWWSVDEIAASDAVFAPRRLAELLRRFLAEGPPPAPIDAGT